MGQDGVAVAVDAAPIGAAVAQPLGHTERYFAQLGAVRARGMQVEDGENAAHKQELDDGGGETGSWSGPTNITSMCDCGHPRRRPVRLILKLKVNFNYYGDEREDIRITRALTIVHRRGTRTKHFTASHPGQQLSRRRGLHPGSRRDPAHQQLHPPLDEPRLGLQLYPGMAGTTARTSPVELHRNAHRSW